MKIEPIAFIFKISVLLCFGHAPKGKWSIVHHTTLGADITCILNYCSVLALEKLVS